MKEEMKLGLYELYVNEGLTLFKGYEQRLSFYTGLIVAIIGGTVYCFVQIGLYDILIYFVFLGLALLIFISEVAIWSLNRLYMQLLENITVRAKIEFDLGFTSERISSEPNINDWNGWIPEPYIGKRHIESRKGYSSSEEFIEFERKKGYQHKIAFVIRLLYFALLLPLIAYIVWINLSFSF